MTADDLGAFTEALQTVAFVCNGRRAHDDHVAVYFRLLHEYPIGPLVKALDRFARTAETGRRFPSPKEIREWMPRPAPPSARRNPDAPVQDLAWWKAHWAAEDERTGRWRIRRALGG
jgi:hypothetical protein